MSKVKELKKQLEQQNKDKHASVITSPERLEELKSIQRGSSVKELISQHNQIIQEVEKERMKYLEEEMRLMCSKEKQNNEVGDSKSPFENFQVQQEDKETELIFQKETEESQEDYNYEEEQTEKIDFFKGFPSSIQLQLRKVDIQNSQLHVQYQNSKNEQLYENETQPEQTEEKIKIELIQKLFQEQNQPFNQQQQENQGVQKYPRLTEQFTKLKQQLNSISFIQQENQIQQQSEERIMIQKLKINEKKIIKQAVENHETNKVAILCLTCEKYIKIENVEGHSLVCHAIEENLSNYDFDNKMRKLQLAIDDVIQDCQHETAKSNLEELQQILILAIKSFEYEKIFELYQTLLLFKPNNIQSLIFSKRCLTLCKEKTIEVNEINQAEKLKNKITILEQQTLNKKKELEDLRKQNQLSIQNLITHNQSTQGQSIERINSDIEITSEILSENSDSSEQSNIQIGPGQRKQKYFKDEKIKSPDSQQKKEKFQDSNEMRRIFYSQALALKLQLPKNHPSNNLEIQNLYMKCVKEKIQMSQWSNFLMKEMGYQ